jgi:predicted enzyme related to lactoylglutathione lyase
VKLCGICILTDNAPGLAAFYEIALREAPDIDGQHYAFENAQLSVHNPGDVIVAAEKNMSLMFFVSDLTAEYDRLLNEIPGIKITSPPERRPWGAFSFWFLDPDGNTISFIEKSGV